MQLYGYPDAQHHRYDEFNWYLVYIKSSQYQDWHKYKGKIGKDCQRSENKMVRQSPVLEHNLVGPPQEPEYSPSPVRGTVYIQVRAQEKGAK